MTEDTLTITKWYADNNLPSNVILSQEQLDDRIPYPSNEMKEMLHSHQQTVRQLHEKIHRLNKRLDDTKQFCDSLWEQLKDYENGL